MSLRPLALLAAANALVFACSPASSISDSGASDSGTPPDGGQMQNDSGTDAGANDSGPPDAGNSDAGPLPDGGLPSTLAFTCAATTAPPNPKPCPAPSGSSGHADFCYRAQWSGVTSVEVYGGFGTGTDWTKPFLTLTNDGTGTFTGSASLANGSYPYLFRTQGSADALVTNNHYFLDQENPKFEPAPSGSPLQRSVSTLTVPQVAPTLVHLKGSVVYAGYPQSCFSVDVEAGELVDAGHVVSEHYTANYAESLADGSFDFPVAADAPYIIIVRFPFGLAEPDGGYPDSALTPSVGITKSGMSVGSGDLTLNPSDISYPLADYAAMSPVTGSATLPVTFTLTVIPGSKAAQVSVTSTNIAGNDPAFASGYSMATSVVWDGGFTGAHGGVTLGTTYYWGAWDERPPPSDAGVTWVSESLLFPIVFH